MQDLQYLQDLQNKKFEELKEKLLALNLNNNKLSFDEYSEEYFGIRRVGEIPMR